jgi:hypothetical protein
LTVPDTIHIHAVTSMNTVAYVFYMMTNAKGLASDPGRFRFSAYCMDEQALRYVQAASQFKELGVQAVSCVQAGVLSGGQGSVQHGVGVNAAVAAFSPDAHNAIIDGDTVVLRLDWDTVLVDMLQLHDVCGISYRDQKGDHPQFWYQRTPSLSWVAFRHGTDMSGFDAMPLKASNMVINTPQLVELYHVPLGSQLVRDTGWELPGFIKQKQLRSYGIPARRGVIFGYDTPFLEHALADRPFVAHMQRSLRHPFKKTPLSRSFYAACEAYIAEQLEGDGS